MVRQYTVDNGEPITGARLIELSIELFEREIHICGKCSKPRTVVKAVWFLQNILHKTIKTKLTPETEWKLVK